MMVSWSGEVFPGDWRTLGGLADTDSQRERYAAFIAWELQRVVPVFKKTKQGNAEDRK